MFGEQEEIENVEEYVKTLKSFFFLFPLLIVCLNPSLESLNVILWGMVKNIYCLILL